MVKKVIFVSRNAAEKTSGMPDWAVISITEPDSAFGEAKLMPGWHAILRLGFHDVDPKQGCDEPHVLMNEQHAFEIVQFVREQAPYVDGILVHCKAGISRSAAVAMWIAGEYRLPFNHRYALYNRHVYRLLMETAKVFVDVKASNAGGRSGALERNKNEH